MGNLPIDDATTHTGTPTYVPDGSAIHDGDPATYIDLATPFTSTDWIFAEFQPPSAAATSITFTVVASRTTANRSHLEWGLLDQSVIQVEGQFDLDPSPIDTPTTFTRTFDDAYFAPGGQGETEDFVSPTGLTFADFRDALRTNTPPYLQFFTNGIGTGTKIVRLIEVTLADNIAGLYPLRRYPPVNNGGSGPTRHYPRAVNRRAGGTY